MATITGYTAERMAEIEGASVVDGDIVGDNLILTKRDGSEINAGNVRGPQGDPGPVGSDLSVVTAQTILDVGLVNQIRAGRQLSASDFTNMGLTAPAGLWNLGNLTDASGNGRSLSNKGAVPFDGIGINGAAASAARFVGSTGQALYIADSGAGDPFRIRTGSFGCWFRTGKRGTYQSLITKLSADPNKTWDLLIRDTNVVGAGSYPTGSQASNVIVVGTTDICDNRWHFVVAVFDGTLARIYIDGILESIAQIGPLYTGTSGPVNIGASQADGSTAGVNPHYGRIDEAFVTADILSEDEIRNLYCAKITHTLAAIPSRVTLNVKRRRRGAALLAGDFPTQPLRLHNFSGGSLGDEGSGGTALTNNGGASGVAGADGTLGNAFGFTGAEYLSATDAGLPATTAARSYGAWFKTANGALQCIMSWGTYSTNANFLHIQNGNIVAASGADAITGPYVADGVWHFAVVVEDNTAADGVKRKLYLDGRLVGTSTTINSITLAGANKFHVGSLPDVSNSWKFTGQIDAAFVCDYALTPEQIMPLFAKSSQTLTSSPKNAGDHVEAMDANNVFVIFDTIDVQHQIDLKVAA